MARRSEPRRDVVLPNEEERVMHDELLVVGTLHTQDPLRPRAEAALIHGGRFACVGTREE